jgi:hypothetical protein
VAAAAARGAAGAGAAAAAATVAVAARGQRLRPDNWESMTKPERESWRQNANRKAKGKRLRFT